MGRVGRVALLLLAAAGLGACAYGQEPAPYRPPAFTQEAPESGAELYAQVCAWCHGAQGEGTERGPNLDGELDGGAYTHFMLTSGRMPIPSQDTETIRRPSYFTEEQVALLVEHVESFGGTGPPVPRPRPLVGDLSDGFGIYLTSCAACHSSTGIGGTLTLGQAVPDLTHPAITPVQVAEAILVGPGCENTNPACGFGSGAMPRFDLTDEQMNSITAYVEFLQGAGNHGGLSLGRIGPVTEGAVAWLVGVAGMMIISRWIGTRVGEEDENGVGEGE